MILDYFQLFICLNAISLALHFVCICPTHIKALPISMPMPILSCHSGHIAIFENMFRRLRSVYVESSPQARSCPWSDPLQAAQSNCGTFPRMFKPTILYQEPSQPSRAAEQATGNTPRKSKNCPCPL